MRRPRWLVGCVLAVFTATSVAACTTDRSVDDAPRSILSGGTRTCAAEGSACTKPRAVRWVVPLQGTYQVRGSAPGAGHVRPVSSDDEYGQVLVSSHGDRLLVAAGSRLAGLDAATGRTAWSRTTQGEATRVFLHGDRWLVLQSTSGGRDRYLSVDPATGKVRTIALYSDEEAVQPENGATEVPRDSLLLVRGGPSAGGAVAGIRRVDLTTGRTLWRTRVGEFWHDDIEAGVMYFDDRQVRNDLPKDAENRNQMRAVQRVDVKTGERLPEIRLPKALWGPRSLEYVTSHGIVVFADAPVDGGTKYAVDKHGRRVTPVPSSTERDEPVKESPLRIAGQGRSVVQHLVPDSRSSSAKRWRGPAMRAADFPHLTRTKPRLVVTAACAPDAVREASRVVCDKPRLFAVNW